MILTDNKAYAQKAKYLITQAKDDEVRYIHHEIGYNYRLNNIQAAMGLAQLEKIHEFIARRRAITQYYQEQLADVEGITVGSEMKWAWSNCWLSWILVEADYGTSKDELLRDFNGKGIAARAFFIPLHTLPPYRQYQSYKMSGAMTLYDKGINLPSHTTLSEEDLDVVVNTVRTHLEIKWRRLA